MSKKGTFNGPFFNAFTTRLHGTPINFGIIIGSKAREGLREIVFAAPTPPEPRPEDEPPAEPVKDVVAHLKSKDGPAFAAWAAQHAETIRKLLPAGLEPCGCFAVVSAAQQKDLAALVTPVLKGMGDASFVLTIDGGKMSWWKHSGGAKAALHPAQLKADSHADALLLWASVPVDVASPSCGADPEKSAKAVERSVRDALSRCICGVLPSEDGADSSSAAMRMVDTASETNVAAVATKGCSELRVAFLHEGSFLSAPQDMEATARCIRQRCLTVTTAVVLRRDLELRHMVDLLKEAIVASVVERLQLASDEREEDAAGPLQLPWRALWRPQDSELPLWCGDYCMPDEDAKAARERLGQLLGLPEEAFAGAPAHLNEHKRLEEDYTGTYKEAGAGGSAGAGGDSSGQKKGPDMSKVVCAGVVSLVIALAIPAILSQIN